MLFISNISISISNISTSIINISKYGLTYLLLCDGLRSCYWTLGTQTTTNRIWINKARMVQLDKMSTNILLEFIK